jgi:hypothetical protein
MGHRDTEVVLALLGYFNRCAANIPNTVKPTPSTATGLSCQAAATPTPAVAQSQPRRLEDVASGVFSVICRKA